ncbi:MAG TPA: cupin domain-containing protein [Ginsengibacter sp.]|nr:cupin domain-containing protein [Ginsengibacter sp.]
MNATNLINQLQLRPHPEGGYFKETYRSNESIAQDALPKRFTGERSFSTAIYYLLQKGERSVFHKIKSDECWHFYEGGTLLIHIIDNDGNYYCIKLGKDLAAGETFQYAVPANTWFASEPAPAACIAWLAAQLHPVLILLILKLPIKNYCYHLFLRTSKLLNAFVNNRYSPQAVITRFLLPP